MYRKVDEIGRSRDWGSRDLGIIARAKHLGPIGLRQANQKMIDQKQSNDQKPGEYKTKSDSLVRPNMIGCLTKQSTKQTNTRTITITANVQ